MHFEKRNDLDALKMIMYAPGVPSQTAPKESISVVRALTKMSSGLPISLNQIGLRARNLIKYKKGVHSSCV